MVKSTQRRDRAAKTSTVTLTRQTLEICYASVRNIPAANAGQAFAVAQALAELEAMLGAVPTQAAPAEEAAAAPEPTPITKATSKKK